MDPVPMPTRVSDQQQVVGTEKVNITKWEKELSEIVDQKQGRGEKKKKRPSTVQLKNMKILPLHLIL